MQPSSGGQKSMVSGRNSRERPVQDPNQLDLWDVMSQPTRWDPVERRYARHEDDPTIAPRYEPPAWASIEPTASDEEFTANVAQNCSHQ